MEVYASPPPSPRTLASMLQTASVTVDLQPWTIKKSVQEEQESQAEEISPPSLKSSSSPNEVLLPPLPSHAADFGFPGSHEKASGFTSNPTRGSLRIGEQRSRQQCPDH